MDDFAQTREPDDLFDSEIAPVQAPEPAPQTQPSYPATPALTASAPQAPPHTPRGPRGRGRGGRNAHNAPRPPRQQSNVPSAPSEPAQPEAQTVPVEPEVVVAGAFAAATIPTGPAAQKPTNVSDRSTTGGVRKPKLTDEELAAKMARVKLNNQRLLEKRRKAEEDEKRFLKEEEEMKKIDAETREKEEKARIEAEKGQRELDKEREKNRERKMKAAGHREWDQEKKEEDYNPPQQREPMYRKGAHGVVSNDAGPSDPTVPPPPRATLGTWMPPSRTKRQEQAKQQEPTPEETQTSSPPSAPRSQRGGRGRGGRGDFQNDFPSPRGRGGFKNDSRSPRGQRGGQRGGLGDFNPPRGPRGQNRGGHRNDDRSFSAVTTEPATGGWDEPPPAPGAGDDGFAVPSTAPTDGWDAPAATDDFAVPSSKADQSGWDVPASSEAPKKENIPPAKKNSSPKSKSTQKNKKVDFNKDEVVPDDDGFSRPTEKQKLAIGMPPKLETNGEKFNWADEMLSPAGTTPWSEQVEEGW